VLGVDGAVSFRFTDPDGRVKTEGASPRGRGPGQGPPRDGDRPPARGQGGGRGGERPEGQPPARGDRPAPREGRQQPPPPPPPPRDPAAGSTRVADVDAALGRVLAAVERLHLADDTVVIFTSDNGGTREYVAALRGGKRQLYEGGIRVPLVIAGPGIRGGRHVDDPVSSIDV
jgi:hypothetical protein